MIALLQVVALIALATFPLARWANHVPVRPFTRLNEGLVSETIQNPTQLQLDFTHEHAEQLELFERGERR